MKILRIILIGAVIFTGLVYVDYKNKIYKPFNISGEVQEFVIERGENTDLILGNLVRGGLIESELFTKFYVWNNDFGPKFQAGRYELSSSASAHEIITKLIGGHTEGDEMSIKIIEGWTVADISEYLTREGIETKEKNLISLTTSGAQALTNVDLSFLNSIPQDILLEGYLFPDTYTVYSDATASDVTRKMLANFESKLDLTMREDIKNQNKSIHDIIIMASLIEKEVQDADEMRVVSGIFWNRLSSGMRLESDATLTYILKDKVSAHTKKDLELDSPYNSYKYGGLPPTPIGNPGLNAIRAAIYPEETNYLFFLTGKDGKTYFAKTFDGHLDNKRKYLD